MSVEFGFLARHAAVLRLRAGATSTTSTLGANLGDAARRQIRAHNDLEAILLWLARYVDSSPTLASYRKETDRLLLWALANALQEPTKVTPDDLRVFRAFLASPEHSDPLWTVISEIHPISSLTREDLMRYRQFLADPQPASTWITKDGARFATGDPRWRPFSCKLEPASVKQAVVILDNMFGWLVDAGYLRGNPFGLLRGRRTRPAKRVTHYLSAVMWQHVKDSVAAMPQGNAVEQRSHARARWLTTLFYLTGLRISEVAASTMGQFLGETGADGTQRWWLEVVGKGQKYRRVPVSAELLAELMRYRQVHGLAPLPARAEMTPLLLPLRQHAAGVSDVGVNRKTVHNAIAQVLERAADWTEAKGPKYVGHADLIRQATAHWLRQTAAAHMLDSNIDPRTIRDILGRDSLGSTPHYEHIDADRRHDETSQGHKLNGS
ncbi:hypothetical protein AWV79_29565 [Cupriavidus sp. UYMMa02A]|nr:hypothetical protein AWV79_29565 [Cupriavidus sp. UYMMa02A]